MKKLSYLLSAGVLVALFAIVGCGDDNGGGLSEEEQQLAALSGTWNATSVNDGTVERSDYDNFVLIIDGAAKSYTTTGGPDLLPFPEAANFEFGTNVSTSFILEPTNAAINASYTLSGDGNTLSISFNYNGAGFTNSKVEGVVGNWVFNFTKQQ